MQGVTIVDHPLVQHKLTLIRDKSMPSAAIPGSRNHTSCNGIMRSGYVPAHTS